jgi:hypothetical protein
MRKSADDAFHRLFASGMQASAFILHTVAKLISCSGLERVGTEYHILFTVVAVGKNLRCAFCLEHLQQYWVRVRLVSECFF